MEILETYYFSKFYFKKIETVAYRARDERLGLYGGPFSRIGHLVDLEYGTEGALTQFAGNLPLVDYLANLK